VISSKTFVWCESTLCQERDSTGKTITKRFFKQGEQINGQNYYYAKDHLGNIREMTDGTGTVRAEYDYDVFGRQTKLAGDLESDFGYTGFYQEKAACLDLTLFRAYDPEKGRWLSRDPIAESGGINLYDYVLGSTINWVDLFGMTIAGQDNLPVALSPGTPSTSYDSPWWDWGPQIVEDVLLTLVDEIETRVFFDEAKETVERTNQYCELKTEVTNAQDGNGGESTANQWQDLHSSQNPMTNPFNLFSPVQATPVPTVVYPYGD